ncbi:hypothetical protein HDU84_002578 [Entophlyctis sp. JEL0112]|nr:hypothetical protein HDU84_002578 [Entophlyctis sp. JEL0112]
MDVDIEALLEAPFRPSPGKLASNSPAPSALGNGSASARASGGTNDGLDLYAGIEGPEASTSKSDHRNNRHRDSRRERDWDRDRSRSPRDRHRDRDRDRHRGDRDSRRERDRVSGASAVNDDSHTRDRDRDPDRDMERERPKKPTREELKQMEIERDQRTVFIMQLAARVRESDIFDFFQDNGAGKVRDVRYVPFLYALIVFNLKFNRRLVTDRISRKSKGVGYVEFYERTAVQLAINLTGTKLLGIPMIVMHTESEKNRLAEEAAKAAVQATVEVTTGGPTASALARLYVGSLDFALTEDDIRSIFEIYGPIEFVNLHKDVETGRSKGFAFVQFRKAEDAKAALDKMQGFELRGRTVEYFDGFNTSFRLKKIQLKVGYSTEADKSGLSYNNTLPNSSASASAQVFVGGLEDEEKAGVALNAQARAALMAKLARRDEQSTSSPSAASGASSNAQQSATRCVLLKNMFDPASETGDSWDAEIRDDVKEECEKYGKIVHIAVDRNSMGYIYIKFDAIPYAQMAIKALNGRFFAGKQISATFMLDVVYHAKYPDAAYL